MRRLNKQYYYTRDGERKTNCYHVVISKNVIGETNITEDDELKIYAKDNKIIIEKKV